MSVTQTVATSFRSATRSSRPTAFPTQLAGPSKPRSIHDTIRTFRPPTATAPLVPPQSANRLSSHGSAVAGVRAFTPGPAVKMPPATAGLGGGAGGAGAGAGAKKPPSNHLVWYREIVPAMLPVIAIGTAIFFALSLTQTHLSHSRALTESSLRISHLEAELAQLSAQQRRQAIQTKTWGESLGRVLSQVGVGSAGGTAGVQEKEKVKVTGLAGPREVAGEVVEGIKEIEERAVETGRRWWGGSSNNAGTTKLA